MSVGLGDDHVQSWQQIGLDAFGNALGNAATAAIRAYQVPEIEVPRLPIDIAAPTTSLVVGDIPQTIASFEPAQSTLAGSLAAARTTVSGGYAPVEYVPPPGTITLPGIIVTPNGSYQRATPEEEAAFDRSYALNLGWQKEGPENARVQAARAELAASNAAFESTYAAWQRQDSLDVLKVAAMGPVGGVLGVAAAESAWVAGVLSVYDGYEGVRSIEDGHPLWGAFQIGTGGLGLAGAMPGIVNDAATMFSRLSAPMLGSPAAQAGRLDVGVFVPNAVDAAESSLPKFTFRGDSRLEAEIFRDGFAPRGNSTDLLAHALDNTHPPSAFVPTSRSYDVASGFADNVYVLRPVNGIDVNRMLGPASPFPLEQEIAIFGKIPPSNIRAVTRPAEGVSILNPGYRPR